VLEGTLEEMMAVVEEQHGGDSGNSTRYVQSLNVVFTGVFVWSSAAAILLWF
jgi:hypothetical protein